MQYFCVCLASYPWLKHSVGYGSSSLLMTSSSPLTELLRMRTGRSTEISISSSELTCSARNYNVSWGIRSYLSSLRMFGLSLCFSSQSSYSLFEVGISVGISLSSSIFSRRSLSSRALLFLYSWSGVPYPERRAPFSLCLLICLRCLSGSLVNRL